MKKSTSKLPIPRGDRIIVSDRPTTEKPADQKIGSLYIPEGVGAASRATIVNPHFDPMVLAIGPDVKDLDVGDRIVVTAANCWPVKIGEVTYTFTRASDVVAVL